MSAAVAPTPDAAVGAPQDHPATRERVLRSLVDDGPATAAGLAERLGLTAGAVRRHLEALVEAGLLEAGDHAPFGPRARRGRGRPARVYSITDAGRAHLPQAYDALSLEVLRFLRRTAGEEAVQRFAAERLTDQRERFARALAEVPVDERPDALAAMLSADGFAASTAPSSLPAGGVQLCQHHCPVAHAAAEFPALCDAEAAMFAELLGSHVQRLATIGHGAAVCTTHVPPTPTAPPSAIRSTS